MLGASGSCLTKGRGSWGIYPVIRISHWQRVAPKGLNSPALRIYSPPGPRESHQAESCASSKALSVCIETVRAVGV